MDYLRLRIRDVPDRAHTERVVRELAAKLERHCHHLTSCQVTVERPNVHPSSGARWRVRIELHLQGAEPIVVRREQGDREIFEQLDTLLHDAFHAADRQCTERVRRQRGEVKQHPEQELQGVVQELHPDHGILFSLDGRKIYFHEHSLVDFRFDDLRVGMGVSFAEVSGREGPQASTVRVVDSRSGQRTLEGELPS